MNKRIFSLQTSALKEVTKDPLRYVGQMEKLPILLKNQLIKLMTRRMNLNKNLLVLCISPNICVLDLTSCNVDDITLCTVAKTCRRLKYINFNAVRHKRTDVSSNGVKNIALNCKELETLFLKNCINVDDLSIKVVALNCFQLKKFNISGCKITDRSLKYLSTLNKLESINFACTSVTDNGVDDLVKGNCHRSLIDVDMSECNNLTDTSVQILTSSCHELSTLIFHGCKKMTSNSRAILDNFMRKAKQLTWTIY